MKQRSLWSSVALVALAMGACSFPRLSKLTGDDADAGGDGAGTDAGGPTFELQLVAGEIGGRGNADDVGSAARFNRPAGVAVDRTGIVYLADSANFTIRKITASGTVTTFAGAAGQYGSAEGPGGVARFDTPSGVAIDGSGNLYVADTSNSTIRKITSEGVVTTLAGIAGQLGSTDDTGAAARFRFPTGVAVDSTGAVYVADTGNSTIRKIVGGVVTTLAGTAQQPGSADGVGAVARFRNPSSVAVDGGGNVFVADTDNHTIREIAPGGNVTTFAGTAGVSGSANGVGAAARFNRPSGVTVDRNGNLAVADQDNQLIRSVTFGGAVTTLAGTASAAGSTDDTGAAARFRQPSGVALDSVGNVFVADLGNHTLRKITGQGLVTTLAGAASTPGGTNGARDVARFDLPASAAVDAMGNIYIADANRSTIRKITSEGVVTTLAGADGLEGSADGLGATARFTAPFGIAVDGDANVYVADTDNNTIRKITRDGLVSTLAGTAGTTGSTNGAGAAARFNAPVGLAVDDAGDLYVADTNNHLIRKVTAAGVVTTLAGNPGLLGSDNGTGIDARFSYPSGVAVDGAKNVYVADQNNRTIRAITPAGVVTTLAGTASLVGTEDGTGPAARFRSPIAVAVDPAGNVYVSDNQSATLRRISAAGETKTYAGKPDAAGIRLGAAPRFGFPRCLALAGDDLVVCDTNAVVRLHPTAP